jgi:hypothetical protein
MSESKANAAVELWRAVFEQELEAIRLANPEYRRSKELAPEVLVIRAEEQQAGELTEAVSKA